MKKGKHPHPKTLSFLSRENALMRKALRAERKFWRHILFCKECSLLDVLGKYACSEAQILRMQYMCLQDIINLRKPRKKVKY